MKELLQAVQSQLRSNLDYIRDGDIYITPHVNYLPKHVRPPCIGIKDGPIVRTELAGGAWNVQMNVQIVVYVQVHKEEGAIVGDAAAGTKGILEISDDIHTYLDENLLGISGMISAFSPREEESVVFGSETEFIQQKVIDYEYEKEEERA